jgi:hypothetical protein
LTGNDLSTLYAPLVRDGRMEKFYWVPTREDKIGIVTGIFAPDDISQREIVALVDRFPEQAVDFFAAMRARIYDEQIKDFIHKVGLERLSIEVVNPASGIKPTFPKPYFTIDRLIEFGNLLVQEQKSVAESRLVEEYNRVRYGAPPKSF